MKSGVYKISFADGADYIGKSTDIERRWKEHIKSFETGKAAKKMQDRYKRYGLPDFNIICYAHSDHIDLLEEQFIAVEKPELNSVLKEAPYTEEEIHFINEHAGGSKFKWFWQSSTIDHLRKIIEQKTVIDKLTEADSETVNELNEEIARIKSILYDTEHGKVIAELESDINRHIDDKQKLIREVIDVNTVNESLRSELAFEKSKPWYKKLFN